MKTKRDLTILSLLGGRWHSLDAYVHGLLHLKCDPKKIKLLWFTNASDAFVNALNYIKPSVEKKGFEVQIVQDTSLAQSQNLFNEGGQRSNENLNTITALYNAAWQYVDTRDVLFLEDDILVPSHALKRLMKGMDENNKAGMIGSCVFDRHVGAPNEPTTPIVFAWNLAQIPIREGRKLSIAYQLVPIKNPWGLRRADCVGFANSLIRRSRLPKKIVNGLPFKTKNPVKAMQNVGGCDIIFSLELAKMGLEVYCDFDVRALHFNSRGGVH